MLTTAEGAKYLNVSTRFIRMFITPANLKQKKRAEIGISVKILWKKSKKKVTAKNGKICVLTIVKKE